MIEPAVERIIEKEGFPIPYHPTWEIKDSSKIQDFLRCERMYFYEFMLGWKSTIPNNHLVYGEAWHRAMEHLLLEGYSDKAVQEAYNEKFLPYYRSIFAQDTDELCSPKTPANALKALAEYTTWYAEDPLKYEVLFTEVSGTVPIDDKRVLDFRIDSILRERESGLYLSFEHKTKKSSFTQRWYEQWELSVQIGTYTHALYCLYPMEKVKGVMVNGVGFLKTKLDHIRLPQWRNPRQMQVWLWNTLEHVNLIEAEMERLSECKDSDEVMMAFPIRSISCGNFFGCPYLDFCTTWSNPLRKCEKPPMGFEINFWNPRERKPTHKMELKWEGQSEGESSS